MINCSKKLKKNFYLFLLFTRQVKSKLHLNIKMYSQEYQPNFSTFTDLLCKRRKFCWQRCCDTTDCNRKSILTAFLCIRSQSYGHRSLLIFVSFLDISLPLKRNKEKRNKVIASKIEAVAHQSSLLRHENCSLKLGRICQLSSFKVPFCVSSVLVRSLLLEKYPF